MSKRIQMGIAGCGNSARNIHFKQLQAVADWVDVVANFDIDADRAQAVATLYGARAYNTLDAFLAHPGLDVVLVATKPASTHTAIGLAALASGKHVLLEKPMCASREEGLQLIQAAETSGKVLTVFHNRRTADWDADFAGVTFAIGRGLFGDVKLFESTVCGNLIDAEWVFDWGIHVFDQVLTAIRAKPVEVSCGASFPGSDAIRGSWAALIRFENGKTGIASMRTGASGEHPRFSVMGATGGCTWPAGSAKVLAGESKLRIHVPAISRGRQNPPTEPSDVEIDYTPFYRNLYEALHGRAEPLVKPHEALDAVCVATAAMESCRTGRAVSIASIR